MEKKESTQYLVTREILAEMFLISTHEINNLWKNHGMPKESRGVYDLRKVVPFYIRRKNAEVAAQKHGDTTRTEAERLTAVFNMELVRIELAEKQKVTMNILDIEKYITPSIISTRNKLNTLLKEIQSTFPKDEPPEIRKAREEKIQKIIDEKSNELASIPVNLFGAKPKKKKTNKPKKK